MLGRKNDWFTRRPRSAQASSALYSIIQTATLIGLNLYAYLHYLFRLMPHITTPEQWDELLPQNLDSENVNRAFVSDVRWT